MTKLLFFTDVHATGISVNHRKDVYINSIIEKLIWIKNYALDNKYDALLFGGDLFHVPEPSTSIVNSVLEIFVNISKDMPIYGVIGSHDIHGKSLLTKNRTAIGTLLISNAVTFVGPEYREIFDNILLAGFSHTSEEISPCMFDLKLPPNNVLIEIIHHNVVQESVPWDHILASNIKTEAQLVLCGHYHNPFRVKYGNTEFINPGSLGRLENSVGARTRMPKVVSIEIDGLTIKTDVIDIDCAKMDIFKDNIMPFKDGTLELQMNKLFTTLKDVNISKQDPLQIVDVVYNNLEVKNPELKETAIELIQELLCQQ